jgi:hypothetical protein
MGIGISIFLLAVGAILTFAVSASVEGANIETIGVILMVVGGIGLLWSLLAANTWGRGDRTDTTVVREREVL